MNNDVFVFGFVTRRVGIGVEVHIRGDGMPGDEAGKRANFRKDADFVDLDRFRWHLIEVTTLKAAGNA